MGNIGTVMRAGETWLIILWIPRIAGHLKQTYNTTNKKCLEILNDQLKFKVLFQIDDIDDLSFLKCIVVLEGDKTKENPTGKMIMS